MKQGKFLFFTLILSFLCSCTNTDEPGIDHNSHYTNPSNTTIRGTYPISTRHNIFDPDKIISISEDADNQQVVLKFKDNDHKIISIEFSPYTTTIDLQGIGTQLPVVIPSAVSLYSNYQIEVAYKTNDDNLTFDGCVDIGNFQSDLSGKLRSVRNEELMQNDNYLTITLDNPAIKNTYGWDCGVYVTRMCLPSYFNPWLCGGFYCELGATKIPGLENYNISNEEFLNCVFNTNAFSAEDYQGSAEAGICCLNALFTRGALGFFKSGILAIGENAAASNDNLYSGITNLMFPPSAIKYEPVSETDAKLYINPAMLSQICTEWNLSKDNIFTLKKKVSPSGYQSMFANLYKSLQSEIVDGFNFHKTFVETLPNGDLIFFLELDKEVGRKIMRQFMSMIQQPNTYDLFLKRCNRIRPGVYNISEDDLKKAIDALPEIIESCPNLRFGVQVNLPVNYSSPYQ